MCSARREASDPGTRIGFLGHRHSTHVTVALCQRDGTLYVASGEVRLRSPSWPTCVPPVHLSSAVFALYPLL